MVVAHVPTVWNSLPSLEPAPLPAVRPGALAVLTQLETAWTLASETEEDLAGLRVAIASVNARLLHRKLATSIVLAGELEPGFAAYCRMLADTLNPLLTLLDPETPPATAARRVLGDVRVQVEAIAAVAGGSPSGAPAVFDDLLNQLEATDLFLLAP